MATGQHLRVLHWHAGEGGLLSVLELVHLFLDAPVWSEAAMERAKAIWVSHHRSLTKSLERSSADRVYDAMLGSERFAYLLALYVPCLPALSADSCFALRSKILTK